MGNISPRDKMRGLISEQPSKWLENAKWREENEDWLDMSAQVALKILRVLRAKSISQKELAKMIGAKPQFINKIVKGRENLTFKTVCKIEKALNISLLEVPISEEGQNVKRQASPLIMKVYYPETNVTTNWQYSQSSKVGYMSYLTSTFRSKRKKICLNS